MIAYFWHNLYSNSLNFVFFTFTTNETSMKKSINYAVKILFLIRSGCSINVVEQTLTWSTIMKPRASSSIKFFLMNFYCRPSLNPLQKIEVFKYWKDKMKLANVLAPLCSHLNLFPLANQWMQSCIHRIYNVSFSIVQNIITEFREVATMFTPMPNALAKQSENKKPPSTYESYDIALSFFFHWTLCDSSSETSLLL